MAWFLAPTSTTEVNHDSELAKTPEESRLKRVCHIAEARYWRKVGNRSRNNWLRLAAMNASQVAIFSAMICRSEVMHGK
jgi:hypothetical protein